MQSLVRPSGATSAAQCGTGENAGCGGTCARVYTPPGRSGHPGAVPAGQSVRLKSLVFHPRFAALFMPKASATSTLPAEPASYEAALQELEQLVARIETGQLPLDQMLAGYQRGAFLLNFCRQRLDAVQDQIKVLDEGQLQPWTQE